MASDTCMASFACQLRFVLFQRSWVRNVPNLVGWVGGWGVGGWGVGGWAIRVGAVLPSVFFRQMQALSQGLWVLCAEMGVAWHILGVGEVSVPYLSV